MFRFNLKKVKTPEPMVLVSFFLLFLIIAPIFYILLNAFGDIKPTTQVLFDTTLKNIIGNSLLLVIATAILASVIGTFLAYFECFYEYRWRRFFNFALILPFAIPSYLFGYIYADFFSYSGWLISWLRETFGWHIHLDIMNIYGAIFILSLSFFCYIYILLRGFLSRFPAGVIESAQSLGASNTVIFFRIILPLSRAALIAGMSLCIMESLNAYGVPNYFGLHVFSTGIFKAWINYQDLNAAIRLSAILLILVFFFLLTERLTRKPYAITSTKQRPIQRRRLGKKQEWLVVGLFSLFFFFSFVLPIIHLLVWVKQSYGDIQWDLVRRTTKNTLFLTIAGSLLIIVLSLFLNHAQRLKTGPMRVVSNTLANMGYSIPGSVVAIGMLALFISIDHALAGLYRSLGLDRTLLLTLSPFILIFAYAIRFLALGYNGVEAALNRNGKSYYEASLSLGKSPWQSFWRVDLPMIKFSIINAFILIFIEIIKELPLSTLLAPAGFRTLAFEMDRYAGDEQLAMTAIPALIVVFSCFILLLIFYRLQKKK